MMNQKKSKKKLQKANINNSSDDNTKRQSATSCISLFTSFASMVLALVTLIVSCSLQNEVNTFTENMGNLNYDFTIEQSPETISSIDGSIYTISPFIIKMTKSEFSGEYKKCYFATINNSAIDLLEVNDSDENNSDKNDSDEAVAKLFNNHSYVLIDDSLTENDESDSVMTFLLAPGSNNKWSILYVILKAYNGENHYFSIVYSCEQKDKIISEVFTYANIYDRKKVENFLEQAPTINLTVDELTDKISNEFNLLKDKLTE